MGYDVTGRVVWRTPEDAAVAQLVREIAGPECSEGFSRDQVVFDGYGPSDSYGEGVEESEGELTRDHEDALCDFIRLGVAYLLEWQGEDGESGWEAWTPEQKHRSGPLAGGGEDCVTVRALTAALLEDDALNAVQRLRDEAAQPVIADAARCSHEIEHARWLLEAAEAE
jgi:hypothetical protein